MDKPVEKIKDARCARVDFEAQTMAREGRADQLDFFKDVRQENGQNDETSKENKA